MSEHFSTGAARIRALKSSMVSLLTNADEQRISVGQVEQGADLLVEAFQGILNLGSKQLVKDSQGAVAATMEAIESAYADWRELDAAFKDTLGRAYGGYIPHANLMVDAVHADLQRRIGEPVAALYACLRAEWAEHLEDSPWDAFLVDQAEDANGLDLNANLQSLVHGDHLDVEDAVEGLTDRLRYTFASYLERSTESLGLLEESLWTRPEIVVINDYWRRNSKLKILDILRRKNSKLSGAFARVQDFFSPDSVNGDARVSERIVNDVNSVRPDQRNSFYRCLILHPDHEIRRYAVNNVDIESFWKVVTPQAVPCSTILSMLEKIAGSQNYDENFQTVFFQTVHRRLLSLTSRSDVIYATGIIRIFSRLPFFMEDQYFEKMRALIDYVTAKEKYYQLEEGILDRYVAHLEREKDKIGTLKAQAPNLTSIPPVVLRKLARDGHYWHELSMHPMFKIARDTIPHINSPGRAVRIANNHAVNQDVIRAIGKNRSLYNTLPAKIALLSNPRTPPPVSLAYLVDLTRGDVEQLLRKSTVHPETRAHLQRRLQAK